MTPPIDLLAAADRVRRTPLFAAPTPPERGRLAVVEAVQLVATEDEPLFPEAVAGGPFEGATRAKLRIVRSLLRGYPVRYQTARSVEEGDGWREGVFSTILLPGDWSFEPFSATYDLRIAHDWHREGTACGSGSVHVLGLGAVRALEVLSAERWGVCHQCGCWRPAEFLRRAFTYFEDEEDRRLNADARECRRQSPEGWCL